MFNPFPLDCLNNAQENCQKIITENKINLENLLKIKDKTYHNFMRPFMELAIRVNDFFTPIAHLNSVNDTKETRDVFSALLPIITDYSLTISQDERIYNALNKLPKNLMNKAELKVIEDNLISFKLAGIGLDFNSKKIVKDNSMRLAELSDNFSKNLLDSTNNFELLLDTDETFKDMPEIEKAVARTDNNKYRFTLLAPSYISFMTYCSDAALREKVYKAYMTRAENNGEIIEEILTLRSEIATALGYRSYADLTNFTMSVPNVMVVLKMLYTLSKKSKPQAKNELDDMIKFAKTKGQNNINSYDTAYYSNLIKKEVLDFDEELYLPYFEMTRVIDGLMNFVANMFEIKFNEITDTPIWHKDVKVYDLINLQDGKPFARLYLDLITRKEKRGGAWMNNWHTYHYNDKNELQLPTAFIVANFLPSSKENPSFLKHDDITTLFHEMGHTLHHLFSKVPEADISGVNGVEWDAIEFPSQLLELFAYDKNVLKSFAIHYKTGEALPDVMIDKLIANKNFGSAMQLLRQVEFGLFDIQIHKAPASYQMVREILDAVRTDVAVILPPKYTHFETSFSHIFSGGYAAGYYSYKWSEILSDDVYLEFLKHGGVDKTFARKYKECVLEQGGSDKMMNHFIQLMDRKPDENALLKVNGILTQ